MYNLTYFLNFTENEYKQPTDNDSKGYEIISGKWSSENFITG